MDFLDELYMANEERNRVWDPDNVLDAGFKAIELAGEVGETCNVVKKLIREDKHLPGSRATVDQLAEELSDVMICTVLLAQHYGIDLAIHVPRKFNATSRKVGINVEMREREA